MKKLLTILILTVTILLNGNQLHAKEIINWRSLEDAKLKFKGDLFDISEKEATTFIHKLSNKKEVKNIEKEMNKDDFSNNLQLRMIGILNEEQAKAFTKNYSDHENEKNIKKILIDSIQWKLSTEPLDYLEFRIVSRIITGGILSTQIAISNKHILMFAFKEDKQDNTKILIFDISLQQ